MAQWYSQLFFPMRSPVRALCLTNSKIFLLKLIHLKMESVSLWQLCMCKVKRRNHNHSWIIQRVFGRIQAHTNRNETMAQWYSKWSFIHLILTPSPASTKIRKFRLCVSCKDKWSGYNSWVIQNLCSAVQSHTDIKEAMGQLYSQ